jgi:hypothetical protein
MNEVDCGEEAGAVTRRVWAHVIALALLSLLFQARSSALRQMNARCLLQEDYKL